MRTVTFYSYKGGTGRTLLLANIALLAARLGKRVVAVDVDLEAPGLAYKLLDEPPSRCDGLVGWLRDRLSAGRAPLTLGDFLVDVPVRDPFVAGGSLQLMPAGRNPSLNYLQDLVNLGLEQRIAAGDGIDAFVDLQSQLRDDVDPDLVLLDARTGISATNLVTTRVLADDVVALSLDRREQLDGTRSVLRSLTPLTSLRTDEPVALHVVLARVAARPAEIGSYALTDAERAQIDRVRLFLREPADPLRATLNVERIHLLHHEPTLTRGEFLALARTRVLDATALHIDYVRIAEALLGDEVGEAATRVIAATEEPERREALAEFFARPGDITEARGARAARGGLEADSGGGTVAERVEELRAIAARDPTRRPDLAAALYELARGLADVGRPEDALAAIDEALHTYRDLADARPDAFLPNLAASLNNQAATLSNLGRHEDALAAARESVELLRRFAERQPPVGRPQLAQALRSLARRLDAVGDPDAAAAALDESRRITAALLDEA